MIHELNHAIGNGDEYDDGTFYGANHSTSLSQLKWEKWLSGPLRVEPVEMVVDVRPWFDFSTGDYVLPFSISSSFEFGFSEVQFGLAGNAEDDTVTVLVDNRTISVPASIDDDKSLVSQRFVKKD